MSQMLSFLTSSDIPIVKCHRWHQNRNTLCVLMCASQEVTRKNTNPTIPIKKKTDSLNDPIEKNNIKIFQSNRQFDSFFSNCSMPVNGLACAVNEML